MAEVPNVKGKDVLEGIGHRSSYVGSFPSERQNPFRDQQIIISPGLVTKSIKELDKLSSKTGSDRFSL